MSRGYGCQLKPEPTRSTSGQRLTGKLTPRRQQILECIREYVRKNHISPTFREIMEMVGLTSSDTIWKHLEQLEYGGYITRSKHGFRSIRVVDQPSEIDAAVKRICDALLEDGWGISPESLTQLLVKAGAKVLPL